MQIGFSVILQIQLFHGGHLRTSKDDDLEAQIGLKNEAQG